MNKIIVSGFYVGFLPLAPGTFGSLLAILIGLGIELSGGFLFLLTTIIFLFFLGWKASYQYILKNPNRHDPQEIVIDEVVGQLVAYAPISFCAWFLNLEGINSTVVDWLIAFVLFRAFDIFKPWPINWADKMDSAFGVMLDDLLAGLFSAIIITGLILTLLFMGYI